MECEENKTIFTILESYARLPTQLINIIFEYHFPIWDNTPLETWELPPGYHHPTSFIIHSSSPQQPPLLHLCTANADYTPLLSFHLNGQIENLESYHPPLSLSICDIDIEKKSGHIFIVDFHYIHVLNAQRDILRTYNLRLISTKEPMNRNLKECGRNIKVDEQRIYVTISNQHCISIYSKEGEYKNHVGSFISGNSGSQFAHPKGLALVDTKLYVCDSQNHHIKILNKENGEYIGQWGIKGITEGKMDTPCTIYYSADEMKEGVLYVGDRIYVRLFTLDGIFLQRLGEIKKGEGVKVYCNTWNLGVYDNKLYISDFENHRIQIFGKQRLSSHAPTNVTVPKSVKSAGNKEPERRRGTRKRDVCNYYYSDEEKSTKRKKRRTRKQK